MVRPTKPYFLVKVSKQEQKNRREKLGLFSLSLDCEDMSRNIEHGEIVDIGTRAAEVFPEAKIGQILIMHHFVEGNKETRRDSLVYEDDEFNYYVVSSYAQNGKTGEVYGVWDGEKIFPHEDYIFLKKETPAIANKDKDAFIEQAMELTSAGILVFKEYVEERETLTQKLDRLKTEAMHMGKMKQTPETKKAIENNEAERLAISKKMNASTFKPFHIAYCNPILNKWFNREVKENDIVFFQDTAAQTGIEFMEQTYLICKSNYIGWMLN